jgi:hypothetical protein
MGFIDRVLGRSASAARLLDEAQRMAPVLSDILANVAACVEPGMTTAAISDQIEIALKGVRGGWPMVT